MVALQGDGPGVVENSRSVGIPVWVIVSVLVASGSVAVATIVANVEPSSPLALSGALSVGELFTGPRTPSASNQSPGTPLIAPQGSAGSPRT